MSCPACRARLVRADLPAPADGGHAAVWDCPRCGGRAAIFPMLRRVLRADFVGALWKASAEAPPSGAPCPSCRQGMRALNPLGGIRAISVCRPCQLAWFQRDGFAQCPAAKAGVGPALPSEAQRELAMQKVRELDREYRQRDDGSPPDEWWQTVLGTLGMPVEVDAPALVSRPWATWSIAAAMAAVTLATLPCLSAAIREAGFVAADPWRHGGLTFITGFFLHAGLIHLLGNAYFLMVFGDNVEDVLGWRRYLALVAAASLGGDLTHALFDPNGKTPCVGASGGISGIIAFYACAFPKARLAVCLRFWWWMRIPAWGAFAVWVLMQSFGVLQQMLGLSNVSSLAHLGGAAVGIAWWAWWRQTTPRPAEAPAR